MLNCENNQLFHEIQSEILQCSTINKGNTEQYSSEELPVRYDTLRSRNQT